MERNDTKIPGLSGFTALALTALLTLTISVFLGATGIKALYASGPGDGPSPSTKGAIVIAANSQEEPGQESGPNWSGAFHNASDNKVLNIGNYDINPEGIGNFAFFLSAMEDQEFDGVAALDGNDSRTADYMDLRFTLSPDDNSITVTIVNPQNDSATRVVFADTYTRTDN
ncbi:MAG: hypothetical protein LBJ61_02095 [Deltaproteobacteria bacterium]|jgi:hypothetical protein|nr:hypothetical protein [Deltaproteobacteria bacterium]